MPIPEGFIPAPHQIANAAFIEEWDRAALFDSAGTGKSASTLLGMLRVFGERPDSVLIVSPVAVLRMWEKLVRQWFPLTSVKVHASAPALADVAGNNGVHVVTYDVLARNLDKFTHLRWAMVVADEIHYAKTWGTARSDALFGPLGIVHLCDRAVFLTGSPISRWCDDLYGMFKHLCPQQPGARSLRAFQRMFTVQELKRFRPAMPAKLVVTGNQNEHLLWQLLQGAYRRTTLAEAAVNLPPIRIDVLPLDLPLAARGQLWRTLGALSPVLRTLVARWSEQHDADLLPRILAAVASLGSDHVATLRSMLGGMKVPLAVPYILDQVEAYGKVVVLVQHVHYVLLPMQALLREALGEHAVHAIHGSVSSSARAEAEASFNNDDRVKVILLQTKAGGVGINLQKSCCRVIEVEAAWSGEDNLQGYARVHRLGQEQQVLVTRLVLANTIDAAVIATAASKLASASDIITANQETTP